METPVSRLMIDAYLLKNTPKEILTILNYTLAGYGYGLIDSYCIEEGISKSFRLNNRDNNYVYEIKNHHLIINYEFPLYQHEILSFLDFIDEYISAKKGDIIACINTYYHFSSSYEIFYYRKRKPYTEEELETIAKKKKLKEEQNKRFAKWLAHDLVYGNNQNSSN